ncbi:MAG: hypothetical protein AABZ53_06180 [Planctomycetota bacterium]
MLQINFHGVGDGDCIVIEFPDSSVGVVDSRSRPGTSVFPAIERVRGRKLAFCCMTHPHADHFRGLREVMEAADLTGQTSSVFWHTLTELDKIHEGLFTISGFDGKDPATDAQERDDLDYLRKLFLWMAKSHGKDFAESFRQITHRKIAGVQLTLVAPSSLAWASYREEIERKRLAKAPLTYSRANDISLGLMIEYAGKRVWLLGDLGGGEQQALPQRIKAASPGEANRVIKADVIKIAHHGAQNAWNDEVPSLLTTCDASNVVVVSADGSRHPNQKVLDSWVATGKRVVGTWRSATLPSHGALPSWSDSVLDLIAPKYQLNSLRDIRVSIDASGQLTLHVLDVP